MDNRKFFGLLEFANQLGVVTEMLCYESGFCTVEGKTKDGKKFGITLSVKEEEENA